MRKYIITFDMGNTNMAIGIFKARSLVFKTRFETKNSSKIKPFLRKVINKYGVSSIEAVVISSVVPKAVKLLRTAIRTLISVPIYVVGDNMKVPIKNLYFKPKQLGQDRLVNSYAGAMIYGTPLLVIDFGTAITFDVVSVKGEYLGGMIIPGLETSLKALKDSTALLPKVELKQPKLLIGKDTKSSILSGIVFGVASLADGLIVRIKEDIGKNAKVVVTGGDAALVCSYARQIKTVDSDLTLKGLGLVYEAKIKEKSS